MTGAPDHDAPASGPDAAEGAEQDAPDDEYQPDPDAPPDVEGRVAQAQGELHKLLRASAIATASLGAAVLIFDLVKGGGFDTTVGYLLGAAVATLNLWLLSGGFFALMRGHAGVDGKASWRALLAFGGSFVGLILLCFWVVMTHREWSVGFAIGLATPALAGILYGRSLEQ
ncbi:MAG: hypothetical protein HYS27_25220 [Deltaproteobacteria bacterium]|nr:hypothetical protein [Deltaproteobacteria bacterium]